MTDGTGPTTHVSLLLRLRDTPDDQGVWAEFVARYEPRILAWCRQWGLQDADAHDVTQDVLLRLAARMRAFRYDPAGSFRAWLRTVTRHAWSDYLADRGRAAQGSGDTRVVELLNNLAAGDDLAGYLRQEFDQEVLEEARSRVRQRVDPHTWEAFLLTTEEGLSGADVAARLEMTVANVFKAKSRVLKFLLEEVARMDAEDEG
jgi:RNA polymerase sigma-70 factor (ECF subfamily)